TGRRMSRVRSSTRRFSAGKSRSAAILPAPFRQMRCGANRSRSRLSSRLTTTFSRPPTSRLLTTEPTLIRRPIRLSRRRHAATTFGWLRARAPARSVVVDEFRRRPGRDRRSGRPARRSSGDAVRARARAAAGRRSRPGGVAAAVASAGAGRAARRGRPGGGAPARSADAAGVDRRAAVLRAVRIPDHRRAAGFEGEGRLLPVVLRAARAEDLSSLLPVAGGARLRVTAARARAPAAAGRRAGHAAGLDLPVELDHACPGPDRALLVAGGRGAVLSGVAVRRRRAERAAPAAIVFRAGGAGVRVPDRRLDAGTVARDRVPEHLRAHGRAGAGRGGGGRAARPGGGRKAGARSAPRPDAGGGGGGRRGDLRPGANGAGHPDRRLFAAGDRVRAADLRRRDRAGG